MIAVTPAVLNHVPEHMSMMNLYNTAAGVFYDAVCCHNILRRRIVF